MATWTGFALVFFFVLCGVALLSSALTSDRRAVYILRWPGSVCSLLLMLAGAGQLATAKDFSVALWTLNGFGQVSIRIDSLSAVFLFAAGLVYLSCCWFGSGWVKEHYRDGYPGRRYAVLHFALMLSVALILLAGDALTFLLSWECMSILCFLLVNHRHEQDDPAAGYIMLAMSEAGFLAVVVAFLIAGSGAPTFSFAALRDNATHLSSAAAWGVFALGFLGFGVKAGLVPVNYWLPRCYTASPTAFIPVLAGVTLNLGFYGMLRLNGDLVPVAGIGPGLIALAMGSITALVGILYATTENDLKAMLAHSSIENAGVIIAAFGAFLVFRTSGHAVAAAVALTACLYHIVNHSIYKTLLYQGTGYIEQTAGSRDMDRLGGLIRYLPVLSVIFLIGCLAISAIPPFNGFVSEWLTLQTLLRSAVLASPLTKVVFALCGAMLALTAALAVTCFVKVYAMTFLGLHRGGSRPSGTNPIGGAARFSLSLLAVACVLLGILPTYVIPALDRAVEPLSGAMATAALTPPFFTATESNQQLPPAFLQDFHNLGAQTGAGVIPGRGLVVLLRGSEQNPVVFAMSPSYAVGALAILLLIVWFSIKALSRRAVVRRELWAGGLPRLLPELTYTATGFSNPVRVLFQAVFRPNIIEDTRETVAVHFRAAIRRRRDETHLVERLFFRPIGATVSSLGRLLAGMHHGRLDAYVGYTVVFLIFMLFMYRLT
jgi:hydrogenase-4 component B